MGLTDKLWPYLLPNINLDAMFGLIFSGIGILILWASKNIKHIKKLYSQVQKIGWLMLFGGVAYWIFVSFIQDVFSNDKLMITIIVMVFVGVIGGFIFIDPKKFKRGRKR